MFTGFGYCQDDGVTCKSGPRPACRATGPLPCPLAMCAPPRPGCTYTPSDEKDANGCPKNPCGVLECEKIPEPCMMVDCMRGFKLEGQDERGCGGKCVKEKTPETCTACLAAGKKWSVGSCHTQCPMDVSCYAIRSGPRDGKAIARECERAEADAEDTALCSAQKSCGACLGAKPSSSSCQWFDMGGTDAWCGHGCGMLE